MSERHRAMHLPETNGKSCQLKISQRGPDDSPKNRRKLITCASTNVQDLLIVCEMHGRKNETAREEAGV